MNCRKTGIKIHESNNNNTPGYNDSQLDFYNKIKTQNKHTGVRIKSSENNYDNDPFDGVNPFNNPDGEKPIDEVSYAKTGYQEIDLNIDNYSRKDLYKLFGITTQNLTVDIMKICKKIVLKTHPDKSKLEPKYFLFFSKAYKRLYGIYEFQNKNSTKQNTEYTKEENEHAIILDKMFEQNKELKKSGNFNEWFNKEFEKYKIEDENVGYGDWLKSNEDIDDKFSNVSKADMQSVMESHKKKIQSIVKYDGVETQHSSAFGGTSLMQSANNYTSDGAYTDLKQAYIESVIPVTNDDYNKMPKFKNVDEYNRYRSSVDTKPLDKEIALRKLYEENKQQEEQSTALAYYYARQEEQVKKQSQDFWSHIKHIT